MQQTGRIKYTNKNTQTDRTSETHSNFTKQNKEEMKQYETNNKSKSCGWTVQSTDITW